MYLQSRFSYVLIPFIFNPNIDHFKPLCLTIAFVKWPFCHFSKSSLILTINCFFDPFHAWNNYNVVVEAVFVYFDVFLISAPRQINF